MRISLGLLALLALPLAARAEVYDDGGTHVLAHATTNLVEVDNATTLELVTGASIKPSTDTNGLQALGGSTILLRAGEIVGGTGPSGGNGLATWHCNVEVHEGVRLRGGLSTGTTGGKGAHIHAPSPYRCRVEGGSFLGSDNDVHGGLGATLSGSLEILGGLFRGGNGETSSGGIGLWVLGGSGTIETVEVYGGTGSTNGGPALIVNGAHMTIDDGTFIGGEGGQSGGTALKTQGRTHVIVNGGNFVAGSTGTSNRSSLAVIDQSVLELRGGHFDGRVLVTGDAELLVYGAGFVGDGSHAIVGTLVDGTPISVPVSIFGNGRVTLIETVATEQATFGEIKSRY